MSTLFAAMARMTFLIALVLLAACRKEAPAPPPAQPTSTVTALSGDPQDMKDKQVNTVVTIPLDVVPQCYAGSILGGNGAVSKGSTTFGPKDAIYFSMWLKEAPAGLRVSVKVLDEKEKEVNVVSQDAANLKIATLTIPAPKPGKYKLEGYWGGNVACEKGIEVTK